MYVRAASVLANIGLSYARKYATKALGAGAATVAGYKVGKEMAYTKKRSSRKPKTSTRSYKAPPTNVAKRVPKMGFRRKGGVITPVPYGQGQYVQGNLRSRGKPFTEAADNSRAYHVSSTGRKLTGGTLAKRVTLDSLQRQIFFVRAYEQEVTAGAPFWNRLSHVTDATNRYFPLYLYDLTARPQYVGGALQQPYACFRPYCAIAGATDGKIQWQTVAHRNAALVNDDKWQIMEQSSLASTQSFAKSMLSWVDIRLQIQGPRNIPGRIRAHIVQLLDDEYDPCPNNALTTNGTNSVPHQVFWESVIAEDTVNPLHIVTRPSKPGFRILGTKEFVTQPRESIDNDTRGQMHVLKWFMRMNHQCNYNNAGLTYVNDTQFGDGTLYPNTPGYGVSTTTDTRKKIYLLIRSLAPNCTAAVDNTVHGSFESHIRTCHTVMI